VLNSGFNEKDCECIGWMQFYSHTVAELCPNTMPEKYYSDHSNLLVCILDVANC